MTLRVNGIISPASAAGHVVLSSNLTAWDIRGRRDHKVVLVRAKSLRPLEPPEAYKAVPRRVRGLDGQIRPS